MSTRFLTLNSARERESASFWRENVVAVVILPRVLARMSQWRKQVIKCQKVHHFAIWIGLNPPSIKITVLLTFLVNQQYNEAFHGVYFLRIREQSFDKSNPQQFSSSNQKISIIYPVSRYCKLQIVNCKQPFTCGAACINKVIPPNVKLNLRQTTCLVPRPHYCPRPMRFGSRDSSEFWRPFVSTSFPGNKVRVVSGESPTKKSECGSREGARGPRPPFYLQTKLRPEGPKKVFLRPGLLISGSG